MKGFSGVEEKGINVANDALQETASLAALSQILEWQFCFLIPGIEKLFTSSCKGAFFLHAKRHPSCLCHNVTRKHEGCGYTLS